MNSQSGQSGFRCRSCGRLITAKKLSEDLPCPCCEHITWYSDDYGERSATPEENHRIMADLRKGLNIRLTEGKSEVALSALIVPYIPQFGRRVYDTWQYGVMGLGLHEFGNVLGTGMPIREVKELGTGKSFAELWLSEQGIPSLVQGSLEKTIASNLEHEAIGGELWRITFVPVTFDHEIVQRYSKELADKCWGDLCKYADRKVRIETFSNDDIRDFFKDFYFRGDLPLLCEFAFNYVLYDILVKNNKDVQLLTLAKARLEAGGVDRYSILIVEHLEGKESALKFIVRDFKAKRLEKGETSKFWRNKMHSLGAKQVLGWCPCDKCSSSYMSVSGIRIKKKS